MSFDDIQRTAKSKFKKIVKEQIKISALKHHRKLQESHSKAQNLSFA